MTRAVRFSLALVLAALLVLTGQGTAVARTAPGPAGQMVICTGSGPLTVLVDATGQPTGTVRICPDCLASLIDAAPGASPDAPVPLAAAPAPRLGHPPARHSAQPRRARARSPPAGA
jgi:hypothetical protein